MRKLLSWHCHTAVGSRNGFKAAEFQYPIHFYTGKIHHVCRRNAESVAGFIVFEISRAVSPYQHIVVFLEALGNHFAFGVVGIAFVVFGIYNGGMKDVLDKAVKICTQCIGLG